MSTDEALSALLPLFQNYYNVITDNVEKPFDAEAVFESHNEQYYLVKAAKIADVDMNEYVFFAKCDRLDKDKLESLDRVAWERGLSRVRPGYNHRSSDVTLIIIADSIESDTRRSVRKTRHYKSYKWGFNGWSNYRLVAVECSEGKAYYNRQGRNLKKILSNIL